MERKTLLLSANYVPIQVLHWQEAVKLRFEDNADVLVEYDEEIRSPSVVWKWPAVMKLRRQHGKRNNRTVRFSRDGVYQRDKYRCQYCRAKFKRDELTLDHVTPRCRGGKTNYANTVSACKRCNSAKGNKSCDEWGRWPMSKPITPDHLPDTGPRVYADSMPPEWKGFVSPAE